VFYMIRPTKTNLKLYAKWLSDPGQSQKFFGDMVDKCYKVVLNPGNTFMIPSGWVLTPSTLPSRSDSPSPSIDSRSIHT